VGTPLNPLPNALIVDRAGVLLAPWQAWLNQLYVYVAQPANAGGVVVPNSRKVLTTAPLNGGGTLATDLTLSINANGISNSLLATVAADTLKGNNTASPATPTDLTVSQVKTMLAISLTTDVSGTLQAAQFPALTGAVTTPGGSLATTLSASTVANSNLANMAADTLKGNNTGSSATPSDLTVTQVLAMLAGTNASWTVQQTFGAGILLPNAQNISWKDSGGTVRSVLTGIYSDNNTYLDNVAGGTINLRTNSGSDVWTFDTSGNLTCPGQAIATNLIAKAAAGTAGSGQIAYGATTATTASTTSGGATLPALAAGYIIINVAGTARKIPFYAT